MTWQVKNSMTSLMIKILAVIGCILLAVLLLLLWVIVMPRHFWVEYCKADGVLVKMNIGPFKLGLYPLPKFLQKKTDGKKGEKTEKAEKTPSSQPKTEPKPQQKPQREEKTNPLADLQLSFQLVKDVVASAKGIVKRIFKAIKFRDVSFTLPIHAGDVHKTQKMYGAVTNSFYTLSVFLQKHLQITFKSPIFVADFADCYKDSVYFYTQITASPILLLAAGWFAYNQYNNIMENNKKVETTTEKENNNG